MKFLIATIAFLASTHGYVLPDISERIVGGNPANITEVPYTVALLLNNAGTYTQICGGAIIYRNIVLTSAQCSLNTFAGNLRVRAGSSFHSEGGQAITVNIYKQHLLFNNNGNYENDITILFLYTPLDFGLGVAAIALPKQGDAVPDMSVGVISGWGAHFEGGPSPRQLHTANAAVFNQQRCVDIYTNYSLITPKMICAGTGIGDSCRGDTGGPLVIHGVLHGLVSWGDGCGLPDRPSVYTRIAQFKTWIDSET